jgi:uncharacterized protein
VWFIFVFAGLALLSTAGLYVRRRITGTLRELGVREQRVRIVRWVVAWLLWGFPLIVFGAVLVSRLLGTATLPRFDGRAAAYALALPFAWAALVVLQSVPWLVVVDLAHLVARRRHGAATAGRLRAFAVVGVVGAFALYTPLRVLAERGDLRVRHHDVGPAGGAPPFRIGFIADMQQDVHTDADQAREVYALVTAEHPDVVLSGGDWINTGPDHIAAAADAATALHSRLGTFSVRGDHEHFAYVDRERSVDEVERALRERGIAMLNNEVRWFEHHGKRIAVVFLNYNYIVRTAPEQIAALVASVVGADYAIVVTHQLDETLAAQLEGKVDLILGAHTHGGQVNPVIGVTHVPLARLETRYIDGRYQRGTTTIIITAGVGYSIVPFRYAAPGSIDLVDVRL